MVTQGIQISRNEGTEYETKEQANNKTRRKPGQQAEEDTNSLNQDNASPSDHDSTRNDESIEGTVRDTPEAQGGASSFNDRGLLSETIVGTYETISIQKRQAKKDHTSR